MPQSAWTLLHVVTAHVSRVCCASWGSRRLRRTALSFRRIAVVSVAGTVDVALSYCHYCLNDTLLEDYLSYLQDKQVRHVHCLRSPVGNLPCHTATATAPACVIKNACLQTFCVLVQQGIAQPSAVAAAPCACCEQFLAGLLERSNTSQ
jgi:hypothetical protein